MKNLTSNNYFVTPAKRGEADRAVIPGPPTDGSAEEDLTRDPQLSLSVDPGSTKRRSSGMTNFPSRKPRRSKHFFFISTLLLFIGCLSTSLIHAEMSSVDTPEDKILAKGFEAYMDDRNKVALAYFEEVVRINPKNGAAQMALDKVKVRLKRKDVLERTNAVDLANSKLKEGRELMKTNDVVAAIDAFHDALRADPDNKKAVRAMKKIRKQMKSTLKRKKLNLSSWAYARGVMAYLDQDWAKAYRVWSERIVFDPTNVALVNAKTRAENQFVRMMKGEKEEFHRRGAREFYRQGYYLQSKRSWGQVLDVRNDDQEAMEGLARAEQAILTLQGKNKDRKTTNLLEEALELYASQKYPQARKAFQRLQQLDPNFKSAEAYLVRINKKIEGQKYIPRGKPKSASWRQKRSSSEDRPRVAIPDTLENVDARRSQLEEKMRRDPSNIRIKQELDKLTEMQDAESERIYKDGLIAYSQGNRAVAISKWKQVLVLKPEHRKASAALRKAKAEEDRTADGEYQ